MPDREWAITLKVKVTTMSGWKPDKEDVEKWLDEGGGLELTEVVAIEEMKTLWPSKTPFANCATYAHSLVVFSKITSKRSAKSTVRVAG